MKTIMKKILSLILMVTICTNSININAFAETNFQGNDGTWDGVSTQSVYETENYRIIYTLTGYWKGGYNANVRIENIGKDVINNWYLGFRSNSNISNVWNANIETNNADEYIIKNALWNQDIPVGKSVEFGISGNTDFKGFPQRYEILGTYTKVYKDNYSIEYHLDSDWGSGFTGTLFITNNSDVIIEDWVLEFEFNREIINIWNANIVSREDNHYVINNAGYNSNIAVGQTISLGFSGQGGKIEDIVENLEVFSYGIYNIEYIELSDGIIEKDYLEKAIYPKLILNNLSLDNIKLSDDYDGDGISLITEYNYDTNPFSVDTDEDGLNDYDEIYIYNTNPIKYDTDEDLMSDGTEISSSLNPLVKDTDDDGILDNKESVKQIPRINKIESYTIQDVGTLPIVEIRGKGDYSDEMYAISIKNDKSILDINCLVGTAFEFVHNEGMSFENSKLTFQIR